MEDITVATQIRWLAALWLPELAADELGLLVYDPNRVLYTTDLQDLDSRNAVFVIKPSDNGSLTATRLNERELAENSEQTLEHFASEGWQLGTQRPLRGVPRESVKRIHLRPNTDAIAF